MMYSFFMLLWASLYFPFGVVAQSDKPGFKITTWTKPAECQGKGSNFEIGYVFSPLGKEVEIALYLQLEDGGWTVKKYLTKSFGYFKIDARSCQYTGNHYGFAKYTDDKESRFPTEEAVRQQHEASDQTPQFRIYEQIENPDCKGVRLETGYVYSPKGTKVAIVLSLEKLDGSWIKKHYTFFGTGIMDLALQDCNFTGNFKAEVKYIE
ncbi:MAG: hypothetical protein OHK0057_05770 [Thermoflexibacter sp.]